MNKMVTLQPRKRQLMSPDFVRAMLAGHSALGLAFAALIYVVCLSGTLSVFLYEFQRWEQPDAPRVAGKLAPEMIAAAVHTGHAQAVADKAAHDLFIRGPDPNVTPRLLVNYHDHATGAEGSWLADAEGRLVARVRDPWAEFIVSLHINLHLPRTWGMILVGLTGVALLSSLISGLLAHPRIFKDAFALRWGGSRRLQEADLHNRLSVWGLPFHFVVSLSGAVLGLSTLIMGVLALAAYKGDSGAAYATLLGPRAGPNENAAPLPDVAAMIRKIQSEKPDAEFTSLHVDHIGKVGQVVHLGMRTPGHMALANSYYFEGGGEPIGDGGFETGGVGQQILGALSPLHFGWFGGFPVKIAYGVLGLALTVITHSGVAIWLARRRDQGRPVPGWEKVWTAVCWGQPLALAATAGAALLLGADHLLAVYLVAILVAFAVSSLARDARAATRYLPLLAAAALVALAGAHIALWGASITDPMAWIVDAAIIMCAILIALPCIQAMTEHRKCYQDSSLFLSRD